MGLSVFDPAESNPSVCQCFHCGGKCQPLMGGLRGTPDRCGPGGALALELRGTKGTLGTLRPDERQAQCMMGNAGTLHVQFKRICFNQRGGQSPRLNWFKMRRD